jgi:hypothetical protein
MNAQRENSSSDSQCTQPFHPHNSATNDSQTKKSNRDHESSFWIIFIYFLAEESRLCIIFYSCDESFEANVNTHQRDTSDIST